MRSAESEPRRSEKLEQLERKKKELRETANQCFADILKRPAIFYEDLEDIDDETRPALPRMKRLRSKSSLNMTAISASRSVRSRSLEVLKIRS